ncbi:MAG: hypothetical protein IKW98_04615 [Prevotella sp.]|nr:hypothetical protein [Prevotella sp.]
MTDETRPFQHHSHPDDQNGDRFLKIRNILNAVFMIGAIIGIILYLTSSHDVGVIVILVSMAFKAVECVLRFLH